MATEMKSTQAEEIPKSEAGTPEADTNNSKEDFDVNDDTIRKLAKVVREIGNSVKLMEETFNATKNEFKLTSEHMTALAKFNEEHASPIPDNLSDEEKETWDRFNGLDQITPEEVQKIFGVGHPIISIDHSITIQHLKECCNDLVELLSIRKEYQNFYNTYVQMIFLQAESKIEELENMIKLEEDPEKRQKLQDALSEYNSYRLLDFLADSLPEEEKVRIVTASHNKDKLAYYVNRARDKITQMGLSPKIILEISRIETRWLEEKYHKLPNLFLIYFLHQIVFCNSNDPNNTKYKKARAIMVAMTQFSWMSESISSEGQKIILDNIRKLEDQFLEYTTSDDDSSDTENN